MTRPPIWCAGGGAGAAGRSGRARVLGARALALIEATLRGRDPRRDDAGDGRLRNRPPHPRARSRARAAIILLTAYEFARPQIRTAYASGVATSCSNPSTPTSRSKVSVFVELFRKSARSSRRRTPGGGARRRSGGGGRRGAARVGGGRLSRAHRTRADEAHARELELRRMDRLKDEFLATLAHELRNPLASLLSATELLDEREPPTRRCAPVPRHDPAPGRALVCAVEDSLEISRFTQGKIACGRSRSTCARSSIGRSS